MRSSHDNSGDLLQTSEIPDNDFNEAARNGIPDLASTCQKSGNDDIDSICRPCADPTRNKLSGFNPFLSAIRDGDINKVKFFLKSGTDHMTHNSQWETEALTCCHGNSESDSSKLICGSLPEFLNDGEFPIVLEAVRAGEFELCTLLVQAGADVNLQELESGTTALMVAAENGNISCVEYLLKSDASVNVQDVVGETALMIATAASNVEVVKLLLESGAAVNIQERDTGKTALILAVEKVCSPVVELLLQSGADVELQDNNERTALMRAVEIDHIAIIRLLWKFGAGVNNQNLDTLKTLLESGLDVNIISLQQPLCYGKTALMVAAEKGNTEMVQLLLQFGADVNLQSQLTGDTPLTLSVNSYQSNVDTVKLLLHCGADTEVKDKLGNVAARHVEGRKNIHLARVFLQHGIGISIVNWVSGLKGVWNFELLSWRANVHHSQFQWTRGAKSAILQLLDAGANVNEQDEKGGTLLMKAAYEDDMVIISECVKRGADPNVQDCSGRTALMWAAGKSQCDEMVNLLIVNGADVDIQDKKGYSALHWAAQALCENTMKVLLEAGATVDLFDKNGDTPLTIVMDYIRSSGFEECSDLLLEHGASAAYVENTVLHYFIAENDLSRVSKWLERGLGAQAQGMEISNSVFARGNQFHFDVSMFSPTHRSDVSVSTQSKFPPSEMPKRMSPIQLAFCLELPEMVKLLAHLNAFTPSDISELAGNQIFRDVLSAHCQPECAELFQEIFCQPLPLKTLSLITISLNLGWGPRRGHKVERTGLPKPLQRRLLFQ